MEERPPSPASIPPTAGQGRLRAPLGFYPCKVDSAGRLKLPAKYQEYLEKLPDKYLFVTESRGLARIYTNGSWERRLARIEDPQLRWRETFRAELVGCDVDVDPQGRITLPQQLRKELGLEDKTVQLRFYEDVITIYPPDKFEQELQRVQSHRESDLERLAALGIDF
jgi:DNA-binding transcriptional regulator/RsmH inhibitor MraZ